MTAEHPAKFTDAILREFNRVLPEGARVLDPFAGTGRIHDLCFHETVGVEIEKPWADMNPRTIVGNALDLPFPAESFDAIATSPCYGNRMADHHNAMDESKRLTYKHCLGRDLHPDNAGQLHWGPAYQIFHRAAWAEAIRVLKPGGMFVLNISDHIRSGRQMRVTAWHLRTLLRDLNLVSAVDVQTPRMRKGSNSHLRVGFETVAVFTKHPA